MTIHTNGNVAGTERGRAVSALETHTFDTGVTVELRKVSPLLSQQVRKSFPPPKPPMNLVEYGDGKTRLEPNAADPAYQDELALYNEKLSERIQRTMIKRGVEVDIDYVALEQLREEMLDMGVQLDDDDKVAYVSYICIGSTEDLQDLIRKITRRSQPTQEAIAEAIDTFRR